MTTSNIKPQYIPNQRGRDVYATEITNRSPRFKVHSSIGHAKAAITIHSGCYRRYLYAPDGFNPNGQYWRLFKKVGNDWEYIEEFSIEPGVTHDWIQVGINASYPTLVKYDFVKKETPGESSTEASS